jgi:hypothetical protein
MKSVSPSVIATNLYSAWAREPRWIVAPTSIAQFQMASYEVGLEVALWIDSEQIGSVRQASQVILLQKHELQEYAWSRNVSRVLRGASTGRR